jgi:mitochondrial enoyl-[acyl-carrier protein] reductase / trans-2-enoyl-CoA reductase
MYYNIFITSNVFSLGTWRQEAIADEKLLLKVPNDIPAAYASTLAINPATAYCLLREFVKLSPGDWIIQNGANSMVGLAVVQMAREMGIKTINVVRSDR